MELNSPAGILKRNIYIYVLFSYEEYLVCSVLLCFEVFGFKYLEILYVAVAEGLWCFEGGVCFLIPFSL